MLSINVATVIWQVIVTVKLSRQCNSIGKEGKNIGSANILPYVENGVQRFWKND